MVMFFLDYVRHHRVFAGMRRPEKFETGSNDRGDRGERRGGGPRRSAGSRI